VECSAPNPYFNKFEGTVETDAQKIPLDASNLILRGCILKNVHEVIAACIYSGSDTKVVLNSVKF
jgi:magnesium-transporting ATPase (P-type)